jgi:hypothetical protein
MDDLISDFDSMNTWDSEKNYKDLINSIENAIYILETENPTFESIICYINLASNRYNYMTNIGFFDFDLSFDYIKDKFHEFFNCSNGLEKIMISYDIDMYIYNYLEI